MSTRRGFLAGAAATAAGVAGCLGGGSGVGGGCEVEQRQPVQEMPSPTLGADGAAVLVEVFEDFSCPHCATFSLEVFPRILSEYVEPGSVRYRHRDFPIPVRQWAWEAASAARQVQESADAAAFYSFAEGVYRNQSDFSLDVAQTLGDEVGVDGCGVRAAGARDTYRPVVEADKSDGEDRGVGGTPAVFVDGRQVPSPRFSDLQRAIESRL
jgi:protein-disulfide isomerase